MRINIFKLQKYDIQFHGKNNLQLTLNKYNKLILF